MKKVISLLICIVAFLSISFEMTYAAETEYQILPQHSLYTLYLDDEKVVFDNVKNQNINGIEMVPLRFMSELLGWQVDWIPESRTIKMTKSDNSCFVTCTAEDTSIQYGDEKETLVLEYPFKRPLTIIIDGVTYISCYDFCRVTNMKFSVEEQANYRFDFYTYDYLKQIN